MEPIHVTMLGEFSLRLGENAISDSDNRTRKVWQLLSFLICHREQASSQRRLIELLWGEEPASDNPENTLRITLHRVRSLLNQLWPGAGKELILYKDGGYSFSTRIPLVLDYEIFEDLCRKEELQDLLAALDMYKGDFLEKQSDGVWVIPISAHLHNLYVETTLRAAQALIDLEQWDRAVQLCRKAAVSEPYHEPLHRIWMQALAASGDRKAAANVYETLDKRLFDDFGIRPGDETRAVYRETAHSPEERRLRMDEVMTQLQEEGEIKGALRCDYDYFRILCHAQSREMERSGHVTHVALLSLAAGDKPLTDRSKKRIMEQLGEQIRTNLRRGDTYAQCSLSQYIIMLPKANYENSTMVCRRVLGAFHRAHPHVRAKVNFMVQPLTPGFHVP